MTTTAVERGTSLVEYRDLREWLTAVGALGELKTVRGVHWDREMGAIVDMAYRAKGSGRAPAILFDDVPGYPSGYRCLYGMMASPRRFAYTVGGIDVKTAKTSIAYLKQYRERMRDIQYVPPVVVNRSPLLDNVMEGSDIDLFRLPVPVHHELDAGRYIGTACGVITRDPDTGWINVGTYRIQVPEKDVAMCYISPGKHGRLHRDKWFERGQHCPAVAVVGLDPMLFLAARYQVPPGFSELDWVGGMRNEPLEVLQGKYTGLPIPANSEIVLEGEFRCDERRLEGPFGEWPGYYAGGKVEEPVFRIKRVMFRNNPILTCAASMKPPHAHLYERAFTRSAALWEGLEKASVPELKGVWVHEAGSGRTFNVVSIKQRYYGHSRQAGVLASQMVPVAYGNRWTIVVDEDIDPSKLEEVVWAMGTRCDPKEDLEILRKCWSSKIDPMVFDQHYYNSRVVVDACIPYDKRDQFSKVAETSPELRARILERYRDTFVDILGEELV
jgi:4-hydroxy-3-polyprenylbenzoate decarboxylase